MQPSGISKIALLFIALFFTFTAFAQNNVHSAEEKAREQLLFNNGWRFMKYDAPESADSLVYDIRPKVIDKDDSTQADSKPTEAVLAKANKQFVLKPWILPTGNQFISNPAKRYKRPDGSPGADFPFVQNSFDDSDWEKINLPHDWAIKGPFLIGDDAAVGGGMGRLPSPGVGWYRKSFFTPDTDKGKKTYLEIDGAMSYAMVWLNGHLVGGWPYGYASWRVDLTPYLRYGDENQLAIRIDNPPHSSRWYPGGGIYRNVWFIKTNNIHVSQWGTFATSRNISKQSATVDLEVTIENNTEKNEDITLQSTVFELAENGEKCAMIASFPLKKMQLNPFSSKTSKDSVVIDNPALWGPVPNQEPNRYVAVTNILKDGKIIDHVETNFGIRSIEYNGDKGLIVNGEHIFIKGVNQHHDLGALGAAFNKRAAERQLEILREAGVNAIRIAHNPPAPELLDLTDRMGFLVVNEIFDVWERKKTPLDFHLIFPEWHEQDLRSFIRRDRNHPSVILWSIGNEVGEQYTEKEGAALADKLRKIANEEDPTRLTTASMNYAKPDMAFPTSVEVINLNYQGEGIRNAKAYEHLRNKGITTPPLYDNFHKEFPEKVIISSENAAAVSSRGTYVFPVYEGISAPVSDSMGGDSKNKYVSAYELYTVQFGSSADKVFSSLDNHPYVAGGFVWSGWDYLGEPTPYYSARSSYFGIIDLAGFKKDRFYLYQSRWRPNFPMAHILPHWNWPDRKGKITPVHIFTSGDEAELFLNGRTLGRKVKGENEYRLRWDSVRYEPGKLLVKTYKNGRFWAEDIVETTTAPTALQLHADRQTIYADGNDLAFITIDIIDNEGRTVPGANNKISISVVGPAELLATDNGDPTNMTSFASHSRNAFNGKLLAIVRSKKQASGLITIKANSSGIGESILTITSKN